MKTFIFLGLIILGTSAFADESKFTVKIGDLTNLAKSTALEACGTAVHAEGKKPLLITLTHDLSNYTTLTNEAGNWCVVFKRWTGKGAITVIAATLDFKEKSGTVELQ